jgi:hypothetical protein
MLCRPRHWPGCVHACDCAGHKPRVRFGPLGMLPSAHRLRAAPTSPWKPHTQVRVPPERPERPPLLTAKNVALPPSPSPPKVRLLNYKRSGTPFWNMFTLAPMKDSDGAVRFYIGVQVGPLFGGVDGGDQGRRGRERWRCMRPGRVRAAPLAPRGQRSASRCPATGRPPTRFFALHPS